MDYIAPFKRLCYEDTVTVCHRSKPLICSTPIIRKLQQTSDYQDYAEQRPKATNIVDTQKQNGAMEEVIPSHPKIIKKLKVVGYRPTPWKDQILFKAPCTSLIPYENQSKIVEKSVMNYITDQNKMDLCD